MRRVIRNPRRSGRPDPAERIDPTKELSGTVAHHTVKYRFAMALPGIDVLDIGCGFGYGTALLSQSFERVVGVDLSQEAVSTARARYPSHPSFSLMDGQALGFKSDSFDLVTCFEVIEHLLDPDAHLAEVARVTRPGGHYVVSTPVPGSGGSPAENPFHHHEFDALALTETMRSKFRHVELFTQRKRRSSLENALARMDILGFRKLSQLRPLVRGIAAVAPITTSETARLEDFEISPGESAGATEFVAIGSEPIKHGK